jgi:hypothetical protein
MLLIEAKDDLSVRMRCESVALGLEADPQLSIVINLTVVHQYHPAIGAAHGLPAGV